MPENDVTKMKVADLKRELKLRGLVTTGNKNELQDRLQTALIDGELLEDADTAISGEEELLTDEEEEKILGADENELLKSPTTTPTAPDLITSQTGAVTTSAAATTEDDILESPTATSTTARKIVLKRKNSFNTHTTGTVSDDAAVTNNAVAKENTEPSPAKAVKMSERHPITISSGGDDKQKEDAANDAGAATKVSQLTLQERLELRAKKFGIKTNTVTTPATGEAAQLPVAGAAGDDKQIEMLKKRAERFGCVVSSQMAKLDAQEKLIKRKQRFGGGADAGAGATETATVSTDVWAEKARMRLERFKATSEAKTAEDGATTAAAAATTTSAN